MTGIEQLRKLGADAVRGGEVGRAICDIADQIERELECERDTIENLRLELGEARDEAAWVREHGGLETVEARLMPEGFEWPRFEDGAKLAFEDELPDFARTIYKTVKTVKFQADGTAALTNGGGSANVVVIVRPGERVKRPIADTWERLEEDAEKDPCGYFGFDGEEICGKCPASGKNCEQTMARNLVRRARALAGDA